MRKTAVFIAAGLLTASLVAQAQAMGGRGPGMGGPHRGLHGGPMGHFMKLDKDGDHALSKDEFTAHGKRFETLDADRDGTVTSAELTAHFSQKVEKMKSKFLERHDKNGDGSVTGDEVAAKRAEYFGEIDANNDDKVTPGEMLDWHIANRPKDGDGPRHR